MNNTKLLIVNPTAPNQDSTFIKSQIEHLQPSSILHSGFRPYLVDGKSIFSFPLNIEIIRVIIKRLLTRAYNNLYIKSLSSFLKINKYDLILCNYGPQASNIYPACCSSKIPLVAHFHGYDASIYSVLSEYQNRYSNMFEGIAAIISVSNDMTTKLITIGANSERIHTIPYGVNLDLFNKTHPENNANKLIFVGRFTAKKAPDLLIRAFNKALKEVPDSQLVMIGNGELSEVLYKTIQKYKIENAVQVIGWQTHDEIVMQMKSARAYVQHSRIANNGDSEGTPNSILEASACGLPIISTYHAGIKEAVIHEVTGYLVEEGNWSLMGDYMAELLKNPVKAGEMGSAARKHICDNYALDSQSEKLKKVLLSIVKKK